LKKLFAFTVAFPVTESWY